MNGTYSISDSFYYFKPNILPQDYSCTNKNVWLHLTASWTCFGQVIAILIAIIIAVF